MLRVLGKRRPHAALGVWANCDRPRFPLTDQTLAHADRRGEIGLVHVEKLSVRPYRCAGDGPRLLFARHRVLSAIDQIVFLQSDHFVAESRAEFRAALLTALSVEG
jgi:hypothetical protein